jgi:hypothetical protein
MHTHGRVRALPRKVRAVQLAEQRKASDERSAESIACRACNEQDRCCAGTARVEAARARRAKVECMTWECEGGIVYR